MFQKLPIPLSQVKAGNTSKHLLNENRQMIYWIKQTGLLKQYIKIKWSQ